MTGVCGAGRFYGDFRVADVRMRVLGDRNAPAKNGVRSSNSKKEQKDDS